MNSESIHKKKWMSETQWKLAKVAAEFCGGFHHCFELKHCGTGVMFNAPGNYLATFDYDGLTRLVALGHKNLIRAGVELETREFSIPADHGGGVFEKGVLVITFHQRVKIGAKTSGWQHHPSLRANLKRLGFADLLDPSKPSDAPAPESEAA